MNLPAELVSLLQDEASVAWCRDSLAKALANLGKDKEKILSTRPPFGVLASSQAREVFQASLRTAIDSEAGLRSRLDELKQIDVGLKATTEKALHEYMASVSAEYRCCHDAIRVVAQWETTVEALREMCLAIAQDAHALSVAGMSSAMPNAISVPKFIAEQSRTRALANLRASIAALETGVAEVKMVRAEFAKLCDAGADGLQLPEPPDFRQVEWLDSLRGMTVSQSAAEATICETEARHFCAEGIRGLVRQGQEVREACQDAANAIVALRWRQLRSSPHGKQVKDRELDEL
ncbi:MAG: hypothetical protein JWM35_2256, partial [Verrucomicrobia bacterium]|nr:hypothetical protein [Verrucomicrobiota bacterium]